jgi:uncharacterized protein
MPAVQITTDILVFLFFGGLLAGFVDSIAGGGGLMVFVYTLLNRQLGFKSRDALMSQQRFFILFGLTLGFYDGFFGPGTGSFWTAALLVLLGHDMTKAAGTTRIMNFTSNVVALCIFMIGHNVLYRAGICMATGQMIGARIGSGPAIRNGARFIRPLFLSAIYISRISHTRFGWHLNHFSSKRSLCKQPAHPMKKC